MKAVRVADNEIPDNAGEFSWHTDDATGEVKAIFMNLPVGSYARVDVARGSAPGNKVWGWDGDMETPTLTPSILQHNIWHGYLTKGEFVTC